jgi:hypothetical protein
VQLACRLTRPSGLLCGLSWSFTFKLAPVAVTCHYLVLRSTLTVSDGNLVRPAKAAIKWLPAAAGAASGIWCLMTWQLA